jgi:uncharacterized protein
MARYNPSTIIMSDDFEESLKGHTYTEFHQVFEHLSKQGNETIQATLAVMYAGGIIVPKDEKEAARWWWIAASQGDATAQFNLGLLYENGKRTSDFAEASVWYRLSAEQGNAEAQYKLGLMYEQGWGVEKDKTEAVRQYRRAAEQGHNVAKISLTLLYSEGKEMPINFVQAYMWYLVAKSNLHEGNNKIREDLEQGVNDILKKMTPDQISEGQELAQDWIKQFQS